MADEAINVLRQALAATQSADAGQRKQAENFLATMETRPMYAQQLVGVIEAHCAGETVEDKTIRTIAAVVFKNLVKAKWAPEDDGDGKHHCLAESDKEMIRANLVPLMCRAPPDVQRQFAEALTIISRVDFPARWPNLIPDLVSLMKTSEQDYHSLNGALLSANSVLKRYRYAFKSDALFSELKHIVLPQMSEPVLLLFKQSFSTVEQYKTNKEMLCQVLESVRLIMRIFYSLNWQDLPEVFENNMSQWMEGFHTYLTSYSNPLMDQPEGSEKAGPVETVQAAIVENILLYTDKYDEEFAPHLRQFAQAVWGLLMKVSAGKHHDALATTCIKFLTLVVGKQIHRELFGSEETLREIVKNIAIPNVKMRPADEETFEFNPEDYINGDIDGGDNETRRRGACDLLRAMCKHYEEQTTRICSTFVGGMYQEYGANPSANWRSKDAALQLVLALSVRAQSKAGGVSKTNAFINVMDVFTTHVLPEIQDADVDARPIIRADCIKFVYTFRNQFTIDQLLALMPVLIAHLRSEHTVVVTYAAMAIERILAIKDRTPGQRPTLRLQKESLVPFLEDLFKGLFAVLDEEGENDYLMKTVMRALHSAEEKILPITQVVLTKLNGYLERVCKNPSRPRYNHFLFESIAVLVQQCLENDPRLANTLEEALFPPFQKVLANDVVEFLPYVFQIFSQLLELRSGGDFSDGYKNLFPPLLSPPVWERKGNIPAVTRLIQAYLSQNAVAIVEWGRLEAVLAVFQKLLSSKANETFAFQLLGTIVMNLDKSRVDKYLPTIFGLLLRRLMNNKTVKYVRFLTIFLCTFIAKYGVAALEQCLQQQEAGMINKLLSQVWIPNFSNRLVLSPLERKVQVVGMTKLMCQSQEVMQNATLWQGLLVCIMETLVPEEASKNKDDVEEPDDEEEEIAFDSAFSKLRMTGSGAQDPVAEIPSETMFLAKSLADLCASQPGKYPPLVAAALSGRPSGLKEFQGFLATAGVSLA
ncbi:unnamed protein product [Ascophyllum nodosum]